MNDDKPLILIDVDGVLNPDVTSRQRSRLVYKDGWVQRKVWVDGSQYRLVVNPVHGRWLRELAEETGAELAWGTTWNENANRWVGPLLHLPKLPVAPCPWAEEIPGETHSGKRRDIAVQWTSGRPFVWLDDAKSAKLYVARLAGSQRHHVVKVDEKFGLTLQIIAEAADWLLSLRSETRA